MVGPFRQRRNPRGVVVGDDTFSVPVVGTMHHQMTLAALSAARTVRGHGHYCAALLTVAPDSLRDTRAVVVSISGLEVGHLESEHAESFEYALAPTGYTDAACEDRNSSRMEELQRPWVCWGSPQCQTAVSRSSAGCISA